MYGVNEKDWKLLRKKIGGWQEAYMDRLNQEYMKILQDEELAPSQKFWALEKRIQNDKKDTGVIIEMRRSMMVLNLLSLLNDGAITMEDLEDFSEELKEKIREIRED